MLDPRRVITKLHANVGHASAHQLKRSLAVSVSGNSHLVNYEEAVLEHCETCRDFDNAPNVPIAGTPTESAFNEKAQADLALHDFFALRATDMFSMYSLRLPVQPKNPQEVWGFFVVVGWASLARPRAFRWVRGEN